MAKVRITVGGNMEREASRHFVKAWREAARGKAVRERRLAFESWAALSRVLTTRRLELLHHVRHHEVPSVRALAKALDRDYSNVHADVRALAAAGLLDLDKDGVRADYDAIETRVAI
jgi:predicted transcriptional regulator